MIGYICIDGNGSIKTKNNIKWKILNVICEDEKKKKKGEQQEEDDENDDVIFGRIPSASGENDVDEKKQYDDDDVHHITSSTSHPTQHNKSHPRTSLIGGGPMIRIQNNIGIISAYTTSISNIDRITISIDIFDPSQQFEHIRTDTLQGPIPQHADDDIHGGIFVMGSMKGNGVIIPGGPKPLSFGDGVVTPSIRCVGAGNMLCVFVTEMGQVYTYGQNTCGQCGLGHKEKGQWVHKSVCNEKMCMYVYVCLPMLPQLFTCCCLTHWILFYLISIPFPCCCCSSILLY